MNRKEYQFVCRDLTLHLGRTTKLMGILNATCDSFSNDGIYQDPQKAKDAALRMEAEGADIIDIGGESTRPLAQAVSVEEEKKRVIPIIKKLAGKLKAPISIDTTKSEVAEEALAEGVSIVNDISGLRFDPRMADVIASYQAGCVLMHIQGRPQTMQMNPFYDSLIDEIAASLSESISLALAAGISQKNIIIDPGIGFGKTTEHNLKIIKNLKAFSRLEFPILVGVSRKSFIGNVLNLAVQQRLLGTAASVAAAIFNGAHLVRVHDVKEMAQVARLSDAILNN